jgi:hypothetical protein
VRVRHAGSALNLHTCAKVAASRRPSAFSAVNVDG